MSDMNWAKHNLVHNGNVVSVTAWQEFDWLQQGFSLRSAGNMAESLGDVAAARKHIAEELGFTANQWTGMRQTHGSNIEAVEDGDDSVFNDTDALITSAPGKLLAVMVADCVPLLFVDPVTKTVAVAHAGRRGTQAGIAILTFKRLLKRGSRAQDIQVAIGPSIGPCCYEINPETHEHFDLWAANEQQLRELGAETIIRTDLCTKDHADLFFSHRADAVPGRFAGLIGIT